MSRAEETDFVVLWAANEQYQRPQFVGAWGAGLYDAMVEEFDARVEEAKEWWFTFDHDGEWTFWTTHERVPMPSMPEGAGDER